MLNSEQEEKTKYFLEALNKVSSPLLGRSGEGLFDLGLIVIEDGSQAKIEDLLRFFPQDKAKILKYNNKYETPFIEELTQLIEDRKWVLIDLVEDPGHQMINQLKNLANSNIMQILDYKDREIFNLKLPKESRIVIVVGRDFLENEVSYTGFISIFGPQISLE